MQTLSEHKWCVSDVYKRQALAGYTYQDSRFRHIQAYGEGLPQGLEEIDAATTNRSSEQGYVFSQKRVEGFTDAYTAKGGRCRSIPANPRDPESVCTALRDVYKRQG